MACPSRQGVGCARVKTHPPASPCQKGPSMLGAGWSPPYAPNQCGSQARHSWPGLLHGPATATRSNRGCISAAAQPPNATASGHNPSQHVSSLYELLGVETAASVRDIKAAYRRLARVYHPDVNSSMSGQEKFQVRRHLCRSSWCLRAAAQRQFRSYLTDDQ